MIIPTVRIRKGSGTLALATHRNPPSECSGGVGIATHYEYTPYGAIADSTTSTGAGIDFRAHNPFRFSSEYADDALGLEYYNYRHYNPCDGRWTGRDLIEDDRTFQAYQFCHNAPSVLFDYLGCDWFALPGTPEGGWNAPPHVVSPLVPHPIGPTQPTQLEKDRDELEAELVAKCPQGDEPMPTDWGSKCCKESCKKQAKLLVDMIYDSINRNATEYGGMRGNMIVSFEWLFRVPHSQFDARGCTEWQDIVRAAFINYKTTDDFSEDERCFDAKEDRFLGSAKEDSRGVHNWMNVIPPDSSSQIYIDPWPSGGSRMFPWWSGMFWR